MERIEALHARRRSRSPASPSGFTDLDELTLRLPAVRSDHRRRASVDGKDRASCSTSRSTRRSRQQRSGRVLLARNEQGVARRSACSPPRRASTRRSCARECSGTTTSRASLALPASSRTRRSGSTTRAGITLLEMRSKARRLKADQGSTWSIVDYLQLMQGPANAREPTAGDQPHLALAQGAGEGAARSGHRALAALARAGAAHRRQQAAAALRPA